jgi:DNA end-binding protein Ku
MIAIAEKIIAQKEGPFDPSQFNDRYEEALKAMIADKQKGHKVAKVDEPEDTNVIDLMSALRASLSAKDASARGGKAPAKAGPAPATAKPAAKSEAKSSAKAKGETKSKTAPKTASHAKPRKAG